MSCRLIPRILELQVFFFFFFFFLLLNTIKDLFDSYCVASETYMELQVVHTRTVYYFLKHERGKKSASCLRLNCDDNF